MRPDGAPGLLILPPGLDPERSLGWQVAHWIETFLVHGPGDILGDPIELDPEIFGHLVAAYALGPTGRRLVRRDVFSRLKGRSKSEVAGMLTCVELTGPCRFDHWAVKGETSWWGYEFKKGDPVGRPARSPFIRCLATEEGQSGNTYDNVTVMLEHANEQHPDLFRVDLGRGWQSSTRIFLEGGGEIRPSTASSASKDGGKETFATADETHLWSTKELRRMHNTVTRNMVKRKAAEPWMLETSTMYAPGEESVAELSHRYAEQVSSKKTKNRGLLFDHREGPDPETFDWDDDKALESALRVAAGDAGPWYDFEATVSEIRDPKTERSDSVRYFLNRRSSHEEMAVDGEKWDALVDAERVVADGDRIAVGFDGSIRDDTTVLVGCTADGHLFLIKAWGRPENAPRDWAVPRLEVHAEVNRVMSAYDVGHMFCDIAKWKSEIEGWAELYNKSAPRVVEFDTTKSRMMAQACDRFLTAIAGRGLSHDGGSLLRSHVLAMARNKVRVNDDDGDGRTKFVFVKADARKIDAGIAAVLAVEAAMTMPTSKPVFAY